MRIRRSSLTFIFAGIFLLSTSLLLLYQPSLSEYSSWRPWSNGPLADAGQAHEVDHGHDWPDPVPGDDTLRKNPVISEESKETKLLFSSPLLQARLQNLLDAPVLSYSEAKSSNDKSCPPEFADKQVNQDQLKGNRDFWIDVTKDDIREHRRKIVEYLKTLEKDGVAVMGADSKAGSRRGIVMTAGNKNTVQNALVTVRLLREDYKSKLPIEIFSFSGELKNQQIFSELRNLDAIHYEVPGLHPSPGAWKNYHLKAASIIASSFSEVLYLDSDNVPLRDPGYLFDTKEYKEHGRAVFWPDYNKDHPDNAIWRVLGKECFYTEWEVESGQILIDKRGNDGLNLAALHVASHMQANFDFWFRLSGGDKDTFRYAFWVLEASYLAAPRWVSPLGTSDGSEDSRQEGKFCGLSMLQYDIQMNKEGEYLPLFVHANLLKHHQATWMSKAEKVFWTIKRPSLDTASVPSLDRVSIWVYNQAGMCLDIKVDPATDNQVGAGQEQRIVTERFDEVYGEIFKDFEARWRDAGGVIGGF